MNNAGVFSGDLLVWERARGGCWQQVHRRDQTGAGCKVSQLPHGRPVIRSANTGYPDRHIRGGDTFEAGGCDVQYSRPWSVCLTHVRR